MFQCSSLLGRITEDSNCTDSPVAADSGLSAAVFGLPELKRLVSVVTCFVVLPRYEGRGRRPPAKLALEGTVPTPENRIECVGAFTHLICSAPLWRPSGLSPNAITRVARLGVPAGRHSAWIRSCATLGVGESRRARGAACTRRYAFRFMISSARPRAESLVGETSTSLTILRVDPSSMVSHTDTRTTATPIASGDRSFTKS